jgi:hypothetical protein
MANYFSKFPKLYYSYNDYNTADFVTNLMARFALEKNVKNFTASYYEYDVTDGETPEVIASKFYDSPERHWIILFMNEIVDPQYEWPLSTINLNNYIDKKYSTSQYANSNTSGAGVTYAETNVHSYYKIITTSLSNGEKIIKRYEVDSNTYANVVVSTSNLTLQDNNVITISTTKTTKSYYEYENEENESKRKIKLLKPEFVESLEKEVVNLFRT